MSTHYDDDTLLRYRYDTLAADESNAVAAHLRTCTECASRFAELGRSLELLGRYDAEAELDDGLAERVMEQVREQQRDQEEARARQEAEAAQRSAEEARREAEAARDAALRLLEEPGPAADAPAGRPSPDVERERLGFWAFLGLKAGGSLRAVRLVATLATVAGAVYVAGGSLYFSGVKVTIDTRVSGEDDLIPGSRGMLLVRVLNRLTRQPVAHADVKVGLRGPMGKPSEQAWKLFAGKTDQRGLVDPAFDLPDVADGTYQLEVTASGAGETDRVVYPLRFHRAYKVHLSTDKPLYQPGQTIHIRTLVLRQPTMTPAEDREVAIEVIDPKNNRLMREEVRVSKFGVGAYSLELADDLRLGPYRIQASVDGAKSEMQVQVARYALPKFKISVRPDRPFFLAGETLRADVEARYFFGKAVERGEVRAVLFKPDGSALGDEIKGRTGRDGKWVLTAELPASLAAPGHPETVMMEVAVKDAAGQEERKQQGITVSRDLLQIEVLPEGGRLVAEMENTLFVLTTSPDGQPLPSRVTVTLPDGKTLPVRTHANGLGAFRFTPSKAQLARPSYPGRHVVESRIRSVEYSVRNCYQRNNAQGQATARLVIGAAGRLVSSELSGALAGTPAGQCVKDALGAASFPAFSGPPITVQVSYELQAAGVRERLTRQEIQDAMRFVQPGVEGCYSRYRVPGLANVRLTIAPNGRITAAEVRGTFAGSPTGRCVERAVRRVAFPAFAGAPMTIAYPFILREPRPGPRIRRPARRRMPPRPTWHAGPVQWISPAGGPEHGLGTTLQLRGEDDQGRKGSRSVTLPGVLEKVLVATDQAFYVPADTVQVGIQTISQFTSAVVEGLQEGQTVFRSRVPLTEGRGTAAVDLPAGLTGTVRLDIQAVDPYDVRSPVVSRKIVVAEQQGLTVKMTADRPSFRPGSEAKLRFKVTGPDGSPKAAAIGLTVVDESVFALAASRPALARAFFLLERSLMEAKHNISVAEAVSREPWGEAEQQAGRLLLSLDRDTVRPRRFVKETFEAKVAGLQASRKQFEDNAVLVAVCVGLVLLLVLVVAAARRLPPWAGGILLALAGGIALLIPVEITWVLLVLAVGVVVALAVYGQQSGRFGWAFLLIPAVGVLAVWLLTAKSAEAPDTVSVTAVSQPTETTVEAPTRDEEGKMGSGHRPGPPAGRAGAFALREQEEEGDLKAALEPPTGAPAPRRRKGRGNLDALDDLVDGALGGAKKDKAEARAEAARAIPRRHVRVRRHFPETMYVHPELVTDEKGVAELALPMADSITEWRVSALASSADGKLGALDRPLKAFQDFFVDLDMPVALVRGDEATIPVAVYNYLSVPQTVRLEVKQEEWFEVLGPTRLAVQLEPGGVDGVEIRIRVVQSGRHRLTLRADGTKLSDALARELLVSEAGQERSDSASGTLRPGEVVRVTVQVPDAAVQGTARLMAKLFPSRLASALDGLENALRMPHGCFEQTSSATYPNVLIYDYLKRAGKLTPEFERRAKRYIGLGYQRLLRFEVAGGGFEWFGRPPANRVLTAYGLMEFSDMSRVFAVDPNLIRRTQRWLVSRQNGDGSWSPDARSISDGLWRSGFNGTLMVTAYIAWALAESGYRGSALDRGLGYLSNNLTRIDDAYTLSLAAAALARASFKDKARLEAATAGLQRLATRQDKLTYFKPARATVYYGRGAAGNVETTALAAYALGLLGRAPETVEAALGYLAANRDYRGTWHSTQGTILALRALLAGAGTDASQKVTVRINGQDAGSHALDAAADKPVLVDLGTRARAGVNVVELSGGARATFQVVATYTLPWQEKGAEEDRPLALKVSYDRTRVRVGGIVPVEVQLTYRKPEPSGMVLLALGLPAGLAPLPEDLQALVSSGKVARYELAQSRVNLYIDRLATGATETYRLRLKARSKVRTQGVGSLAYLYYHPEVRAAAPPASVTIN